MFFGVGRLARDLVALLVVPAIPLMLAEASLTVSVLTAGVGVLAAWRDLTRARIDLEDRDEIRVFQAIAPDMWVLERPSRSGKRIPVLRGVLRADLETSLAPDLNSAQVAAAVDRLQNKGIIERIHGDRWRIVF